jgi:hypothetical protein
MTCDVGAVLAPELALTSRRRNLLLIFHSQGNRPSQSRACPVPSLDVKARSSRNKANRHHHSLSAINKAKLSSEMTNQLDSIVSQASILASSSSGWLSRCALGYSLFQRDRPTGLCALQRDPTPTTSILSWHTHTHVLSVHASPIDQQPHHELPSLPPGR